MLSDLSAASRVWAVIATKTRREETTAVFFEKEGFDVYLPRLMNKRLSTSVQALFPGYLFVKLSPKVELPKVRYYPGVIRPLLFGDQLACVEPELIEHWKAREGGRGFLTPEAKPAFEVGQRVRFAEGAFVGLEGTVLENLPSKDRVRVLLDYLGGTIPVEADRDLMR